MANMPLWATPERRNFLAKLADKSNGGCTLGFKPPEAVYRNLFMMGFFDLTIADVVLDDDSSRAVCRHCQKHYRVLTEGEDVITEAIEYEVVSVDCDSPVRGPHKELRQRYVRVQKVNHLPGIIDEWKEDDREERSERHRLEQQILHCTPDATGWGRRFDPIERAKFFDRQPGHYIEGFGISGLTFKPFAKVRIPSTNQRLFVDVPPHDLFKLTKNARKRIKRQRLLSAEQSCTEAVQDYWKKIR